MEGESLSEEGILSLQGNNLGRDGVSPQVWWAISLSVLCLFVQPVTTSLAALQLDVSTKRHGHTLHSWFSTLPQHHHCQKYELSTTHTHTIIPIRILDHSLHCITVIIMKYWYMQTSLSDHNNYYYEGHYSFRVLILS